MAKNNWDNRKLLAEVVVVGLTPEECRKAAIGFLMHHYDGNESFCDERFHDDWFHHEMDEKLSESETKEIKALVVGEDT